MLSLCEAEGIGVIPWSPQAHGKTEPHPGLHQRAHRDRRGGHSAVRQNQEADKKVVDRVAEVANARGSSRAQVALGWLLAKPVITAPIVGATKLHHLDIALASVAVKLTTEEMEFGFA